MSDLADILMVSLFFFFGMLAGVFLHCGYCHGVHEKPMEELGIEKFQRCEINTTNCHSNWYEIIWKEKNHK